MDRLEYIPGDLVYILDVLESLAIVTVTMQLTMMKTKAYKKLMLM